MPSCTIIVVFFLRPRLYVHTRAHTYTYIYVHIYNPRIIRSEMLDISLISSSRRASNAAQLIFNGSKTDCRIDAYRSISFRRNDARSQVSRRCSSFPTTRSPNDSRTRSSCTFRARHVGPRVSESIISTGGLLVVCHGLSVRSRVRVARSSTDLHFHPLFLLSIELASDHHEYIYSSSFSFSSSSSSSSSFSPPPPFSRDARYLLGSIYVGSLHQSIGQ